MKREIKFRALKDDMSNCRYYYGSIVFDIEGNPRIHDVDTNLFHGCIKGTEGQFTGLKDKNGVDIYEGDIVNQEIWFSVGKYAPSIGVIKYKGIKFTSECIGEWKGSNADLNGNASVIGNIYENPELINK